MRPFWYLPRGAVSVVPSTRRSNVVAVAAILLAAVVVAGGCDVYDPDLVDPPTPPGGCETPSRPPARPSAPDDGVDLGEVAFAVKNVLFDQDGDRWKTIGYDLDGRCTEPPGFDVECVPMDRGASPEVDGVGGTDNSFGHNLFPLVSLTVSGLQEASRRYQEIGNGSVIVRVTGWNGLDDDSQVHVVAAVTVFGAAANPDGSRPDVTILPDGTPTLPGGGAPSPPRWDGTDWLWARDDNFLDGDETQPFIVDDAAYVARRVLVVKLPERTSFVFPGDDVGLEAKLTDAVATGRISANGALWEDVVLAGRWSVLDLTTTAESVGVCDGTPQYDIFQNQLGRISDVRSRRDSGGPDVPCDAVSVGLGFDGYAVHFGGLAPGAPVANPCRGMGTTDGGVPDAGPP